MPARVDHASVVDVWVACGSKQPVDEHDVHAIVVEQDLDQPDMCVLTLNNAAHEFSGKTELGDEVEVKVGGSSGTTIFKGEVVGIEPLYKSGSESRCIVRAFNRMHRLLRGRKSRTFLDMKDSDIASQIASDNGLSPECDSTSVSHDHLYQHNQTDLEFLRLCAARNGFEVLVEDRTLHFRKPQVDRDSGIELRYNDASADYMLRSFSPRLSSAGIVQEVEVRAWNPEKKEEIVGRATTSSSRLGPKTGPDQVESVFGRKVTFTVDRPVETVEEANKLAEARLGELMMDYITGEGLCVGNAELKAGIVVKVTVNTDRDDDRFNGRYLVVGASHRYRHSAAEGGGQAGGYTTTLRVRRDAEGGS
jgi:uncharacterized protein